jgi:hypothetical protein
MAVLGALALCCVVAPAADGATYTNPTAIAINDNAAATPYPAAISVSGLPGQVVKARATLRTFAHGRPSDADVLLEAPSSQRTLLISDACDNVPLGGESLIIDESAASTLPNGSCIGFNGGSFKPTNFGLGDVFPAPAPSGPYPVTLSLITGADPNGTWNLWVSDEAPGVVAGSFLGGWSLELLTGAACSGKPVAAAANEGTAAGETIEGTSGPDVIVGLDGADTVRGLGGNDVICGGGGNDKLIGGPGADTLLGEGGKDKLTGSGGKDLCKGGPKPDTAASCEKKKSL